MNEPTNQIATTPKNEIEYTAFQSDERIKLTVAIVQKYVAIPTRSGKLPDERDCIRFMMLSRARKLNPFEGDCFLQGYDGKDGPQFSLITAHQAFLKRAEVHPEYDGMESGVIVEDKEKKMVEREGDFLYPGDNLLGAWAVVHFTKRKHPTKRKVNLRTFQKSYGRWQDDPAGMIVKCAEADALRSSFPTMLGGLYGKEEVEAINIESSVVHPPQPSALPQFGPTPTPAPEKPKRANKPKEPVDVTPTAESKPEAAPTTTEPEPTFEQIVDGQDAQNETLSKLRTALALADCNEGQAVAFYNANRGPEKAEIKTLAEMPADSQQRLLPMLEKKDGATVKMMRSITL